MDSKLSGRIFLLDIVTLGTTEQKSVEWQVNLNPGPPD